jgi:hypothetical protein
VVGVLVVTRLLFKDGIQLYELPASPAEITDAYSPFHPAGQPFHRIQPHHQRLNTHHLPVTVGRTVSAQEPKLSQCTLTDAAVQRGGRSFLRQQSPKPSASSPTHKTIIHGQGDKNCDYFKAEYPITAMLIFSVLCSTYLAIKI